MAPMQLKRLLIPALLLATGVACGPSSLEPLPLDGSLTASPNPADAGEEVQFTVNAQGTQLLSLELDYGDGDDDLQSVVGSRTARWTQPHAFDAPGQYTVTARINERTDTTSRTVTMTINPAASATVRIPEVVK
jgi:hypothetical protein